MKEMVKVKPANSGGAYLAFKRSAPVYPTASAAVQLTVGGKICKDIAIVLGCVGLTPVRAKEAEAALRGQSITAAAMASAADASRTTGDPHSYMRRSDGDNAH